MSTRDRRSAQRQCQQLSSPLVEQEYLTALVRRTRTTGLIPADRALRLRLEWAAQLLGTMTGSYLGRY